MIRPIRYRVSGFLFEGPGSASKARSMARVIQARERENPTPEGFGLGPQIVREERRASGWMEAGLLYYERIVL